MAPKRQIEGGQLRAFWLGERQWRALLAFGRRHGILDARGQVNRSRAIRALLDVVAEHEGIPG